MADTAAVIMPVVMIVAIFAMLVLYAVSYNRFPPNKLAVLTRGDPKKGNASYRFVTGGGKFVLPGAEKVTLLDLNAYLAKFVVDKVPTASDGPPKTVRLEVATIWKITSSQDALKEAAEGLVARTRGENEMAVKELVERALVNMGPGMTADAFRGDRDALSAGIQRHASVPLMSMGIEIRSFHILDLHEQG
jgi:uncharacterized membrane protein YqiK